MSGKQVATKSPGFLEKVRRYLRSAWNELKKVHWPNKSELVTYTSVVLVAVVIVSAMIFIVDSILSTIMELLV
ncbi:MAG: preprotein translocase subunit SecE [Clostridia bacterium]|nr:preprotein translocase subunit SecE [Clostridia bacterium]